MQALDHKYNSLPVKATAPDPDDSISIQSLWQYRTDKWLWAKKIWFSFMWNTEATNDYHYWLAMGLAISFLCLKYSNKKSILVTPKTNLPNIPVEMQGNACEDINKTV